MNKTIEAAIRVFSPAHAQAVLTKLHALRLPTGDIKAHAVAVKDILRATNTHEADFPNPFQRGTDAHAAWQKGFNPEADKATPAAAPTDVEGGVAPLPNFQGMTKPEIDTWAASKGITLDGRLTKAKMIAALTEALAAA